MYIHTNMYFNFVLLFVCLSVQKYIKMAVDTVHMEGFSYVEFSGFLEFLEFRFG